MAKHVCGRCGEAGHHRQRCPQGEYRPPKHYRAQAEELIRQGVNDTEIARRLPVRRQVILSWRQKLEAAGVTSTARLKWKESLEHCAAYRERRVQREEAASVVYFVFDPTREWVKIGFSVNVDQRLKTLRTGNPMVRLLATMPGGQVLERQMHTRFSALRVDPAHEWFRHEGELAAFVKGLNASSSLNSIERLAS